MPPRGMSRKPKRAWGMGEPRRQRLFFSRGGFVGMNGDLELADVG